LHGHIYKSVCVHKNVYAYISSKRVQQYVYIYTCVVLSALFLCADDVILLEKKKIIQIVSWMDAEKKIFLSHSQSERKRFHNQHTRITNFSSFFIPKHLLLLLLGQKRNKTLISHHSFFLSFFFSSKLFCACVAAPKEREREKSAAGESARKYTHTHTHARLYNNNNNKRPSCKKERENIVCVYCARVVDIQEE